MIVKATKMKSDRVIQNQLNQIPIHATETSVDSRSGTEDCAYVCAAGSWLIVKASMKVGGYGIYDITSMVKVEGEWIDGALIRGGCEVE